MVIAMVSLYLFPLEGRAEKQKQQPLQGNINSHSSVPGVVIDYSPPETEKKPASLGVQGNWPFRVGTMEEKCRVYTNRKNEFKEVPAFLKGLRYTMQYRKRIMNISGRIKNSGVIYLGLFGNITPTQIGQQGIWEKCGILKVSDTDKHQSMMVYKTYTQKDKTIVFNQRDHLGLTVFAKEIEIDKARPLPEIPDINSMKKVLACKSVRGRPIEYLVFGQGDDVVFIMAAIHGDELAGITLVHQLAEYLGKHQELLKNRKVILLPVANPDGAAEFQHSNAHGVNLNRNFPSSNRRNSKNKGFFALSEPEARVIHGIIEKYLPDRVVSIHQMMGWTIKSNKGPGMVDFEGPSEHLASVMSGHCGLPVKKFGTQKGSLGAYVGDDLGVSIITLEIPKFAYGLTSEQLWKKYGKALIAVVTYPEKTK
jgi:protein MpaA